VKEKSGGETRRLITSDDFSECCSDHAAEIALMRLSRRRLRVLLSYLGRAKVADQLEVPSNQNCVVRYLDELGVIILIQDVNYCSRFLDSLKPLL
jgi:hypothetical protein